MLVATISEQKLPQGFACGNILWSPPSSLFVLGTYPPTSPSVPAILDPPSQLLRTLLHGQAASAPGEAQPGVKLQRRLTLPAPTVVTHHRQSSYSPHKGYPPAMHWHKVAWEFLVESVQKTLRSNITSIYLVYLPHKDSTPNINKHYPI